MSVTNFDLHFVIGRGGFGKVWRVENKKSRKVFALKEMNKAKFIVNMTYAFQDRQNLYLVMDLLTGGDLRFHLSRQRKFDEDQTKFFAVCIINGLEYLHSNGVLHRDIKPENLVFENTGYLRITDLGIARAWKADNASDTSGTPGYMAPEVMCRQNYGVGVDYYAVGVIVYECMLGKRPYVGKTRQEIRDQVLAKQVQIKRQDVPEGWSLEAADFVNRLIQRKPTNRLGLNGPDEVKGHVWIKDFSWAKLARKEIQPPFIPSQTENNFLSSDIARKETNEDSNGQNIIMLRRDSIQKLFSGYDFDVASSPAQNISIESKKYSLPPVHSVSSNANLISNGQAADTLPASHASSATHSRPGSSVLISQQLPSQYSSSAQNSHNSSQSHFQKPLAQ